MQIRISNKESIRFFCQPDHSNHSDADSDADDDTPTPTLTWPASMVWQDSRFNSSFFSQLCLDEPLLARQGLNPLLITTAACTQHPTMTMCVKMRYPLAEHQKELDTYMTMMEKEGVYSAFVPILCAFEVVVLANGEEQTWGGLCMPFLDFTVCNIMSISPRPSAKTDMQRLSAAFLLRQPPNDNDERDDRDPTTAKLMRQHGMPLIGGRGGFEMAILAACFRLLYSVHAHGWVHGDTHMGNFMLDTTTWRVYLIDAERSFQSKDSVQYLLDAQELFGHATGLLISMHNHISWDMQDVWAVMSRMHPSTTATQQQTPSLAAFIPVCTCFVHDIRCHRIRGCSLCMSPVNSQQATRYAKEAHLWVRGTNQSMLDTLSCQIKECRQECRVDMQELSSLFTIYAPAIHRRLVLHKKSLAPELLTLMHILSTRSPTKIKVWLNYTLYRGAIVGCGAARATRVAKFLAQCAAKELSLKFLSMIAPSPPKNEAEAAV